MFRIERYVDKVIQERFQQNKEEGEDEQGYWERHWKGLSGYYEEHGVPFEIKDAWWKNLYDEILSYYEQALGGVSGKTVCELGSGSGYSSLMMAQRGARATLVDYTAASSAYSRQICRFLEIETNDVTFITEDAFSEALDIGKHDVVWNCGVIEHYQWEQAVRLVRVMASHVREGGKVMVTLPNLCSPELLYKMTIEGKGSEIFHSYRMLQRIMEEAGLSNVRVDPINYWVPSFLDAKHANRMRKVKMLRPFKGLAWLFNGIGEKQTG